MKIPLLFALASPLFLQAIEYEVQSENDLVRISKIKLESKEEVGYHRDELPRVVFAIKGGSIQRINEDGSGDVVHFPTGQAVFLDADPANAMHRGINISDTELEIIVVQLKVIP